jgi:hypothetical protein
LNVNYAIRDSQINDVDLTIQKETKSKEYILETNIDPGINLGKVQKKMNNLSISPQGISTSRIVKIKSNKGGILQGFPLIS